MASVYFNRFHELIYIMVTMYYKVWVASQQFHGKDSLTYYSNEILAKGQIVSVPLQRKSVLGVIDCSTAKPKFVTKLILQCWPYIIPSQSLRLMTWLFGYYPAPLGTTTELFTPPPLGKKVLTHTDNTPTPEIAKLPNLTTEQASIVQQIAISRPGSILLHGDTGTGKTRIYLELTLRALRSKRSVMILTPEIGLTEQLRKTFESNFGTAVIVTHSDMTPAQRRQIWLQIATSITPLIIIGPRSAVFAPVSNLGLIVMDEAHDGAYKQEQSPYYQTSRVAARLARLHDAHFIMGTATPLLADYYAFSQKSLPILRMSTSALPIKTKTTHLIVDLREKQLFSRSPWLSTPLLKEIDLCLERSEQTLLFLNRRGSARLVLCDKCGWQAMCPHCDVALTYHQDQHLVRCHSCDFSDHTPSSCPICGASELIFRSIGTKALETEIKRLYPQARIARFDRDTEKSLRLSSQYSDLHDGTIDILIGTQSISKGFDLPKLSVVGIIQADGGLQIPDFTSNERTFQLISQVSGRVGRGHIAGKMILQTFQPDSPLIADALSKDYAHFYAKELAERKAYHFPPYYFLLKVSFARASSKSAQSACQKIANSIKPKNNSYIVEGPTPRFIEKISGRYAWNLIIKAQSRSTLLKIVTYLPANCTYDLDPSDLL